MTTALKRMMGIALIILGIVGTLLPIVPGFVLILLGVGLLGTNHPLVKKFEQFLKRNNRKVAQQKET